MRAWFRAGLFMGLAACGGSKQEDSGPARSEASACDPLVPEICALPFPSSHFQVPAATVSGVQNAFPAEGVLPVNRDGVPLQPDAWNRLDGFSTIGSIVAYFPEVSLTGLPGHDDLGASLSESSRSILLDPATGERVPHFVELDQTAESDDERVLLLRPMVPLKHGTRYVVAYRNLEKAGGEAVPPSDAFRRLRDGEGAPELGARGDRYPAEIFAPLEAAGFAQGELTLAWDFWTVSRESSLGGMLKMRDEARAGWLPGGPSYTIDSIEETDCSVPGETMARTVYGTLRVPQYTDIDAAGARLVLGPDGLPVASGEATSAFMVRIPCSLAADPGEGGMILQYGHGLLGGLGEARTGYLSEMAQANRWVIFAQDWKGMSSADAGHITLMMAFDISGFPTIPERSQQGFLEMVAGLDLIRGDLAQDPALQFEGRSVVDPDRFAYYGNSQGGIMGGAYLALSPIVERGVLGVAGSPYAILLSRSADFDPFFLVFKEKYLDGREISMILAMLQTLWDPGEAAGWLSSMTADPLPGAVPKQALLQVGIGDAQVTTLGAQIMARAYGAKTVAPETRPVYGVEEAEAPFTGSALVEWYYPDGSTEPFENLPPATEGDVHECPRREPAAQAQLRDFVETGEIRQYCEGICEGSREQTCGG